MKTLMILAHPEMGKSIANKRITEGVKAKVDNFRCKRYILIIP